MTGSYFQLNKRHSGTIHFWPWAVNRHGFIDDVRLQVGSREVWRRDYSGGTVLVNVSGTEKNIELGETFQKILGIQVPEINDGSEINQVTLQARDGLILLRPGGIAGMPESMVPLFQLLLLNNQ